MLKDDYLSNICRTGQNRNGCLFAFDTITSFGMPQDISEKVGVVKRVQHSNINLLNEDGRRNLRPNCFHNYHFSSKGSK